MAAHLPPRAVAAVPEVRLHTAQPGSGLRRLTSGRGAAPYWAYAWGGGAALARHVLDHPDTVAGRRVLDLGAGSGLVGIAAALAGAATVLAAEVDPLARIALGLNAALNGVVVSLLPGDVTAGPPPPVDLVLAGDVFYAAPLARRMTGFLDRCTAAGVTVLVGDPGRAHLPQARLRPLARYAVGDVGGGAQAAGTVFAFMPATAAVPALAPHPEVR